MIPTTTNALQLAQEVVQHSSNITPGPGAPHHYLPISNSTTHNYHVHNFTDSTTGEPTNELKHPPKHGEDMLIMKESDILGIMS